jgi:predicted ArsR family transcriptional regulator
MSKRNPKAADGETRRVILDLLKADGPARADELAEKIGITAMAVRQHLKTLLEQDMVTQQSVPKQIGRPAKMWCLTEKANTAFPDGHQELALSLIDCMRESFGEDGLARIIAARAEQQTMIYQTRLQATDQSLRAKVTALAAARHAEGYMAHVEEDGDGSLLLVENHCPICSAASTCRQLCARELDVFQNVLGPGVMVERTDHILAGARRCAYRITPKPS